MLTPAIAAILGAGVGALATSLAAVVTAISSTRRERRARLFTERMGAYTDFMLVMGSVQAAVIEPNSNEKTDLGSFSRGIEALQLIGSRDVRELVPQAWPVLSALIEAKSDLIDRLTQEQIDSDEPVKDAEFDQVNARFNEMYETMQAAMRADLDNR